MRKNAITTTVTTAFGLALTGATAAVLFGATAAHTSPAGHTAPAVSVVDDGPTATPTPTPSKLNTPWG